MAYDHNNLDFDDLHYLLNLCTTIMREKDIRVRFVDQEFNPNLNRSTIIRCHHKLRLLLQSRNLKPKILTLPTQWSSRRGSLKPK